MSATPPGGKSTDFSAGKCHLLYFVVVPESLSEKAILGALGEFRGILGAALGVQTTLLGMRNPILRMGSHDLSNAKATIFGATLGAIHGIGGNPHEQGK